MIEILKILTDPNSLKALISPFSPALSRVVLIVTGIVMGILYVSMGLPPFGITFTSADPAHLTDGYKDQWVKNAAIAYEQGVYEDADAVAADALQVAGFTSEDVQELAEANSGTRFESALLSVQELPNTSVAESNRVSGGGIIGNIILPFFCIIGMFVLGTVLGVVLSFRPIPIGKWRKGAVAGNEATAGMGQQEKERREAMKAAQEAASAAAAESADLGDPETTSMSAYVFGDNLYDDSFPIEPGGGFAGEYGVGIAETIGEGEPKKVTAFELWLFDQAEIQTVTYVLMSEHAYNDQAIRAKLAPRGEAVMIQPNGTVDIDSKSLKMRVKILNFEYGEGSLPPNSFFSKATFNMTIWLKDGADAGGAPAMPSPAGGNFAPPPQMPPQGQPQQPMQPPPSGQPLTNNAPGGQPMPPQQMPPQQMPPQQMPPQPMPPQQMPPQQPGGGIRPLTSNNPGGQMPLPPQRPPSDDDQATTPGRTAPPDPFGDTGQF